MLSIAVAELYIKQNSIYEKTAVETTESMIDFESVDYILNKNTLKVHTLDCDEIENISDENIIYYTGDHSVLEETGYSPCKKCEPW